MCEEPCSGFLAGAVVQSEAREIILPKYGIRDSRLKTLSLQRLYMLLYIVVTICLLIG